MELLGLYVLVSIALLSALGSWFMEQPVKRAGYVRAILLALIGYGALYFSLPVDARQDEVTAVLRECMAIPVSMPVLLFTFSAAFFTRLFMDVVRWFIILVVEIVIPLALHGMGLAILYLGYWCMHLSDAVFDKRKQKRGS